MTNIKEILYGWLSNIYFRNKTPKEKVDRLMEIVKSVETNDNIYEYRERFIYDFIEKIGDYRLVRSERKHLEIIEEEEPDYYCSLKNKQCECGQRMSEAGCMNKTDDGIPEPCSSRQRLCFLLREYLRYHGY